MSCPECVHIELTQSSLLASGTLPVWDKGRERKLRTNKTDFFLLLFFSSLCPKYLNSGDERDPFVLYCFWCGGFYFFNYKNLLNFPRHSVLLPNGRNGGAASGRPAKWTELRGFRFCKYCLQDGEPVVIEMLQTRQTTLRSEERWCCRVTDRFFYFLTSRSIVGQ